METKNVTWPGWETVRLIGRGGFGAVYEIQRKIFDETEKAALKVITIPQNDGDIEEMRSDGYDDETITATLHGHLKSIVGEYSTMRKMNGCSNIVNCDDVRYEPHADGIGWDVYIKMELLTPLTKCLPDPIPEATAVKLARDLCTALELCRKYDVVHRDIKPQNIFVSDNSDYKLGDFGIAKTVEKTMGGTKIGTYKYMAPEVYNNQPYGASADLYSLGLVLYWMLNDRRLPFMPQGVPTMGADEEARACRFSGEPIPAPKNGSEELKRIVLKACAFDPKDRFASAQEMLDALKNLDQTDRVVNKIEVRQDQVFEDPTLGETCGPVFDSDGTAEETMTVGPVFVRESGLALNSEIKTTKETDKTADPIVITEKQKTESALRHRGSRKKLHILLPVVTVLLIGTGLLCAKSIYTGWINHSGDRYYYDKGKKAVGIVAIDNNVYFFDDMGALKTGWAYTGGNTYYLDTEGIVQTGWKNIDGVRYLFDDNGIMQTGWQHVADNTYYLDTNGIMQTSWQTIDGRTYYFDRNGVMQTGFVSYAGRMYFLSEDGELHIGWLENDGHIYFCAPDQDGSIATRKWEIDDEYYYFDDEGIMVKGAVEIEPGTCYYFGKDGTFQYCEVTLTNVPTTSSDKQVTLKAKDSKSFSHCEQFDSPISNVLSVRMKTEITEVESGKPDGQWQIHVRASDGNWKRIGYFNLDDREGTFEKTFDEPMTFDAVVSTAYDRYDSSSGWSGKLRLTVSELKYKSYDYVPDHITNTER